MLLIYLPKSDKKAAITLNKDIWDSITIVVATKSLYDDFKYVISGLLSQRKEKSIDKIQSMLSLAEAKLVNKRKVGVMINLIYISRNSSHKGSRATATNEDKC